MAHFAEIDSNNKIFQDILKIQLERSNSKGKNFMPFSSDFYASNPKEVSSFTIFFDEIFDVVVTRNENQELIYDEKILKIMSKILDSSFISEKSNYDYEELLPHINVNDKKTLHGKQRGVTNRRNQ